MIQRRRVFLVKIYHKKSKNSSVTLREYLRIKGLEKRFSNNHSFPKNDFGGKFGTSDVLSRHGLKAVSTAINRNKK